jgi:hypothetical protein
VNCIQLADCKYSEHDNETSGFIKKGGGISWTVYLLLFCLWDYWHCGHSWPIVTASGDKWRWLWRSRWNVDWQGKPKFSEKTCPSATIVHHKIPHDQSRVRTRAAAVGSRRLTAWAMMRPFLDSWATVRFSSRIVNVWFTAIVCSAYDFNTLPLRLASCLFSISSRTFLTWIYLSHTYSFSPFLFPSDSRLMALSLPFIHYIIRAV